MDGGAERHFNATAIPAIDTDASSVSKVSESNEHLTEIVSRSNGKIVGEDILQFRAMGITVDDDNEPATENIPL